MVVIVGGGGGGGGGIEGGTSSVFGFVAAAEDDEDDDGAGDEDEEEEGKEVRAEAMESRSCRILRVSRSNSACHCSTDASLLVSATSAFNCGSCFTLGEEDIGSATVVM